MRRNCWAFLVCVASLALVCRSSAGGDDAARMILDKAIQARGGEANLSKFKAATLKVKGTIHFGQVAIPFVGELTAQGRDQHRSIVDAEINDQAIRVVTVLNGDKGWMKINDTTMAMDKDKLEQAIEDRHASWVESLLPLKQEKGFKLGPLGEVKVNDKPAVGIHVSYPGRRDINLYFDKTTHQMVKSERRIKDDKGVEMTQESYTTYGKGPGLQGSRLTIKRDGKTFMEAEITEFIPHEKIDASTFGQP